MKGRVPYNCAYQATEPTAARVADANVAREFRNDYISRVSHQKIEKLHSSGERTWKAEDEDDSVDA